MQRNRRRLPLVRVGLTLIVGGFIVAMVRTYVAIGQSAADLSGPDTIPQTRDEFLRGVRDQALHGTSLPSLLVIAGAICCGLGVLRAIGRAIGRALWKR